MSQGLAMSILVRVVQELDLLQHLEATDRDLLELVDPNNLLGWLIIHRDGTLSAECRSLVPIKVVLTFQI